jgi:SAM-dependent methyltransferase
VNSGAVRSAERLLPLLTRHLSIGSVLDVGCGQGAWLSVWQKLGADVVGIDGDYVDARQLLIAESCFLPRDLKEEFALGRRFDMVQSLEVAEHLPPAHAAGFVASLVRHSDLILFSAAPPGQGGDHHINEQSYDYWRTLFARHGYVALDYVRPLLRNDSVVEPWYRYNTLLYASSPRLAALPEVLRRTELPATQRVPDVSPFQYRVRKAMVAMLPVGAMTAIAKMKERLVAARRRGPRARAS